MFGQACAMSLRGKRLPAQLYAIAQPGALPSASRCAIKQRHRLVEPVQHRSPWLIQQGAKSWSSGGSYIHCHLKGRNGLSVRPTPAAVRPQDRPACGGTACASARPRPAKEVAFQPFGGTVASAQGLGALWPSGHIKSWAFSGRSRRHTSRQLHGAIRVGAFSSEP